MSPATIACDTTPAGSIEVSVSGDWLIGRDLPGPDPILDALRRASGSERLQFDTSGLGDWDTGLITTLINIRQSAQANGVAIDDDGLPDGARKLIKLALAVKEREGARRALKSTPFLEQTGAATLELWRYAIDLLTFIGEAVQSLGRQALHAALLGFRHPKTGQELVFERGFPPELEELAALLSYADP